MVQCPVYARRVVTRELHCARREVSTSSHSACMVNMKVLTKLYLKGSPEFRPQLPGSISFGGLGVLTQSVCHVIRTGTAKDGCESCPRKMAMNRRTLASSPCESAGARGRLGMCDNHRDHLIPAATLYHFSHWQEPAAVDWSGAARRRAPNLIRSAATLFSPSHHALHRLQVLGRINVLEQGARRTKIAGLRR